MERRQVLGVASLGIAAGLAGCAGAVPDAETDGRDTTTSTETEPDDATTERGSEAEPTLSIAVDARGEVEAEPDEATASIGVQATGDTAEEVNEELAERSETLRETFDELEIPDENVETGRYDIREDRDEAGYEGTYAFTVTIDDVDRVGEVVDAAVDAGADDVGRIRFGLSDDRRVEMREAAVDHALENADAEAAHIAENRGVEDVTTRSVSTSVVDVVPAAHEPTADVAEDDAVAAETEFDTGPVSVSATVAVEYDANT
ncbi:SIMPL domain-containing protein [Halobacteria archaeon AArc-dxtr1]|nr:SIMPL domain-containing protein [Halobacteria archaeon AArc-dxtr1]